MRYNNILIIAITAMVAATGCSKDYLDVNQDNPNLTQNPPISGLLANVTYQSAINVYRAGYFTSNYVQYLASSNASSGSDTYESLDRSTLWYNVYNTVLDGRRMEELANEQKGYHHIAVAKITEAMNMSMLIDLFGDVPYSQAWNAENFYPGYDKAEDVFNSSLKLLDDAITLLKRTDIGVQLNKSSDLIHNGNPTAWVKTAHALKARLLNRLSKTTNYNPVAILGEIDSAYKSNADDAQLTQFTGRSVWNQIAYNNLVFLLDGWLSNHIVDALNGKTYGYTDPRLPQIASITKFNDYRGTRNGAGRVGNGTSREESYLNIEGFYARNNASLLLITFAEMKFIEAEAALRTPATRARAYRAYLDGIAAHMDKLGISAADKSAYLSNPMVAVGEANLTLAHVMKEKYIAMLLHPEAWTDARRFNYAYKNFTLPLNAQLTEYIRRQPYPDTEISRNSANVPDVNSLTERLWWDK